MKGKQNQPSDSEVIAQIFNSLDAIERKINERDYDILISNNEAARQLGITPNTVARMVKEGRLHRVTIGESTGIRLSEIRRKKTP